MLETTRQYENEDVVSILRGDIVVAGSNNSFVTLPMVENSAGVVGVAKNLAAPGERVSVVVLGAAVVRLEDPAPSISKIVITGPTPGKGMGMDALGNTGEINVVGTITDFTGTIGATEVLVPVFVNPYIHRPVVQEILTATANTKISGYTKSNLTANSIFTLGDGTYAGQRKVITKGEAAAWVLTVTVLNHVTGSPVNFLLLAQYDTIEFEWTGATGWATVASTVSILAVVKQAEVDWGDNPLVEDFKLFTIADAAITVSNRIVASLPYEAATGKELDENDMDTFTLKTVAGAGFFTLAMHSLLGPVHGKFKVNYQIGSM